MRIHKEGNLIILTSVLFAAVIAGSLFYFNGFNVWTCTLLHLICVFINCSLQSADYVSHGIVGNLSASDIEMSAAVKAFQNFLHVYVAV